jgi:hypothetical protein
MRIIERINIVRDMGIGGIISISGFDLSQLEDEGNIIVLLGEKSFSGHFGCDEFVKSEYGDPLYEFASVEVHGIRFVSNRRAK